MAQSAWRDVAEAANCLRHNPRPTHLPPDAADKRAGPLIHADGIS